MIRRQEGRKSISHINSVVFSTLRAEAELFVHMKHINIQDDNEKPAAVTKLNSAPSATP